MRISILAAMLLACAPAFAGTQVGVSIGIHQPGVYGRIDIGHPPPPPALIVARPVVIAPAHATVQPVYMYVPPGHQRNWARHCHAYNACAQPVYFVRESWVRDEYARAHPGKGHKGHGRGHEKGHGKGHGRHD